VCVGIAGGCRHALDDCVQDVLDSLTVFVARYCAAMRRVVADQVGNLCGCSVGIGLRQIDLC